MNSSSIKNLINYAYEYLELHKDDELYVRNRLLEACFMEEYEILAENLKIMWKENFKITNEKYSQVSGYIFNEKNQLLIVKNGSTWTIPGGHSEINETKIETLNREIIYSFSIEK